VSAAEAALLFGCGLAAGTVNTLAGGGSLLTVPALVLLGLPGTLANGTNRVGVLASNLVAARRFRLAGVSGAREALPVLLPAAVGAALGALAISRVADDDFERLYGLVMLALVVPMLRPPRASPGDASASRRRVGPWLSGALFFAVGLYGGAIQAGVGLAFVAALSYAGYDLVRASAIKVLVIASYTLVAVTVFAFEGRIVWGPALALATGFALGGEVGARLAIGGGERAIRIAIALAVVALAGRMLGLY
jgi:uncharacterized membrane protein YfcA